jgi:FkbM family methyltransferase
MKSFLLWIYRFLVRRLTGYRLTRFRPISFLNRSVCSYLARNKGDVFEVNGCRMQVPPANVGIGIQGFSEKHVTDYFKSHIKPGMTVVDIGANIGYYTLLFARLVGQKGRVYAFEPEPTNIRYLKHNLELNDCDNVILIEKAVSNRCGTTQLFLSPDNPGGHALSPAAGEKAVDVGVVTLDSVLGDREVDFIKMDIEGHEYFAIQGMRRLLSRSRATRLVMEYSPPMLREGDVDAQKMLKLLAETGFHFFSIGRMMVSLSLESLIQKSRDGGENSGVMLLCERVGGGILNSAVTAVATDDARRVTPAGTM